jgi:hypothetical protein
MDLLLYGRLIFAGKNALHLKMTIPSALPSIQNLLPDTVSLSASSLNGLSGFTVPGILISLLLIPWLTAGYLGTIAQDIKQPENKLSFIQLAGTFFIRLVLVQLIMMGAMLAITPLFFVPLLGGLVMIALIVLLILLFFWDYSIIYDDTDVISALKKAYSTFTRNFGTMTTVLLPIVILLTPLTAFASFFMNSPVLVLIMLAYAYLGSVLVSGFMHLYTNLNGMDNTIHQAIPFD